MEVILSQLGGILLRAIPTFLLVVFLHFYLKAVFFRPLQNTLQRRFEATQGARKMAEHSLERAAAKTAEFEAAIRAARGQVYHEQEQLHKELQEQQARELKAARHEAEELVRQAKAELAQDVESAKTSLVRESQRLADEITESILRRSAA